MQLGIWHSTIRGDEKLLLQAGQKQGVAVELIDVRDCVFNPTAWRPTINVALERCLSTTLGQQAIIFSEALGIPIVNNSRVAQLCTDKFATSLVLWQAKVPTVPFALAFSEAGAQQAVDQLGGYPSVLKPVVGSWGRLLAKVNDPDALAAIVEHKHVLGTPPHKPLYLQSYINKPGRDIRVVTIGGKSIVAIYRQSDHWITNTARGAAATLCPLDKPLQKICRAASRAVGGGILGIDVFETNDGYLINEINHTTEFKNIQRITGIDVAGAMIAYCLEVAEP